MFCKEINDGLTLCILYLFKSCIDYFYRSYVNSSGPGFSLHSNIVMPYISDYGTDEQIQKFLPEMTAGKKIGAIAMTEPGAGRCGNH